MYACTHNFSPWLFPSQPVVSPSRLLTAQTSRRFLCYILIFPRRGPSHFSRTNMGVDCCSGGGESHAAHFLASSSSQHGDMAHHEVEQGELCDDDSCCDETHSDSVTLACCSSDDEHCDGEYTRLPDLADAESRPDIMSDTATQRNASSLPPRWSAR